MCEFNTNVQSSNSLRLTIVSAKPKIHSPRRGYLSPGNSIVLEKETASLFISVTNSCSSVGDNLTKFKHASITPVYFRVSPSYVPVLLLNDTTI